MAIKDVGTVDGNSLNGKKKAHIEKALAMANSDPERAAEMLQIPLPKLNYWVKKLKIAKCIERPDSGNQEDTIPGNTR